MTVNLSDIIDAIQFTDEYTHNFLDKETGEIVWVNEMAMTMKEQEEAYETLEEHGCYRLPERWELNGYGTMEDFIDSLASGEKRNRLSRAIVGRGAFRRFKDEVCRLGIADQWYKWEENAHRRLAIEWCEENGVKYIDP